MLFKVGLFRGDHFVAYPELTPQTSWKCIAQVSNIQRRIQVHRSPMHPLWKPQVALFLLEPVCCPSTKYTKYTENVFECVTAHQADSPFRAFIFPSLMRK